MNGLLIGASKEMRQSVSIAYQVTYIILIDVIAGIEDLTQRDTAWKTHFLPIFVRYLNHEITNPNLEPYINDVFIEVFVHMKKTSPELFNANWYQGCHFSRLIILHLPDDEKEDGGEWDFKRFVNFTLLLLHRLVNENTMGEKTVKTENLDTTVVSFLGTLSGYFAFIVDHMETSHPGGDWNEGMEFLAAMIEDTLFCECLLNVDSMAGGLKIFKEYVSRTPEKMRLILRWKTFLRVVVVFCRLFIEEGQAIWQSVLDTSISMDRLRDIQKPKSMISELVSILKPSYKYLKAPPGVNETFAREIARVLNLIDDPESEEGTRLMWLFSSIVTLHGNYLTYIC